MRDYFLRTELLVGAEGLEALARARVAVFGVGGVGSYAVEALARAGIGSFLLVDDDVVAPSNINRQLHADTETLGQYKTKLMAGRIARINPDAGVETREVFCLPENVQEILTGPFDYIVDAVDTVSAKLSLAEYGYRSGIPVISCMGAGNKLDPAGFRVADIYETSVCPLCRVMRRELRKRNIPALPVVYSQEPPRTPRTLPGGSQKESAPRTKRQTPGSISFVPPVAGMIAAGKVVRDLLSLD